jgi:beta-galactosidase/beta-glucuronidase
MNRPEWERPSATGRNRETIHVPWGSYEDARQAQGCNRRASRFVKLLNGAWKFKLFQNPVAAPKFFDVHFDAQSWQNMPVPSNWQLQGEDSLTDAHVQQPLPIHAPFTPGQNPTGCYRTTFTLPPSWQDRQVFLVFESVDSAFHLWVNGQEIGFSTDSRLPAEFDITPHLHPGDNTLAVRVLRIAASTHLDGLDLWPMSGIQRDVYLIAKPRTHLRDFTVRTRFDRDYRHATLELHALASPFPKGESWSVSAQLFDPDGQPLFPAPLRDTLNELGLPDETGKQDPYCARLTAPVPLPRPWTPDTPNLYTLVLTLHGPDDRPVDHESCRVGFRQIEFQTGVLLLNGHRLVVRGVDQSEHHPDSGRVLSEAYMRDELSLMKRLNFNAIRTSHYPHDTCWYDLCDELGLLVVDEANLDTHALRVGLSHDPSWATAYLERATRMVLRDRNHPCILAWSLGNESSAGPHQAAMAAWIRTFDKTRPMLCKSGRPGSAVSDLLAPMHPDLDWVNQTLADPSESRPLILGAYACDPGNQACDFHLFWDLVRTIPRIQGGFICDWADQALARRQPNGSRQWLCGNSGGEGPHAARMRLNGVVFADLSLKPGAYEVWQTQAPLRIEPIHASETLAGRFQLFNCYLTGTLAHLDLEWELQADGIPVQSGRMAMPEAAPCEGLTRPNKMGWLRPEGQNPVPAMAILTVPFTPPVASPGTEYYLNLRCVLNRDFPWAARGHTVAWEQFRLPITVPAARTRHSPAQQERIKTACGPVRVEFDPVSGSLASLRVNDFELLKQGPIERFHLARAGINDRPATPPRHAADRQASDWRPLSRSVNACQILHLHEKIGRNNSEEIGLRVVFDTTSADPAGVPLILTRTSYEFIDGLLSVEVDMTAADALPHGLQLGLELVLAPGMEQVDWFGRGPFENAPERKHAAQVGLHRSTVADLCTPDLYLTENGASSEHGARQDVRWVALTRPDGAGLRIRATAPLFRFSARHHPRPDPAAASQEADKSGQNKICLYLNPRQDAACRGTCRGPDGNPECQSSPERIRFGFVFEPLEPRDQPQS